MENKIIIGTVASLYDVSKQTLIHYDRIGLLKPTYIAENNYRYYSFSDMDKLEMILSLKKTGLSLKEIQEYMKSPSLDESIDLLEAQQSKLNVLIDELTRTKEKIDYKIDELKYIAKTDAITQPTLLAKAERYILYEPVDIMKDHDVMDSLRRLKKKIESTDSYHQYVHFFQGVTITKDNLCKEVYHVLDKSFIFIDQVTSHQKEETLAEGQYLCLHHSGPYETTHTSYKIMLDYIQEHDLEIIGDSLEIPLITAWAVTSDQHYITELQIPVRKRETR